MNACSYSYSIAMLLPLLILILFFFFSCSLLFWPFRMLAPSLLPWDCTQLFYIRLFIPLLPTSDNSNINLVFNFHLCNGDFSNFILGAYDLILWCMMNLSVIHTHTDKELDVPTQHDLHKNHCWYLCNIIQITWFYDVWLIYT